MDEGRHPADTTTGAVIREAATDGGDDRGAGAQNAEDMHRDRDTRNKRNDQRWKSSKALSMVTIVLPYHYSTIARIVYNTT